MALSRISLQWGRTPTSAEICLGASGTRTAWCASMGPHSNECGNQRSSTPVRRQRLCFNGAALQRVRKSPRHHANQPPCARASMGPHSNECGNPFAAPESRLVVGASMGPHSNECGNTRTRAPSARGPMLQWGRTPTSAEITSAEVALTAATALQWGRTPTSAEIPGLPDSSARRLPLQWGRTPTSAEISTPDLTRKSPARASMGPHSNECGNPRASRSPRPGRRRLQWGRTPTSAEMTPT